MRGFALFLVIVVVPGIVMSLSLPELVHEVPLPRTADEAYLQEVASGRLGANEYSVYRVTAHEWQGIEWKNHILLLTPREVESDLVLLFVTADYRLRERDLIPFTLAATANSARVAILFDVPNQPLFSGLREDWLISYTFKQFLETGDPEWPALLPMVRSTVTAMNVIDNLIAREGCSVGGFIVLGGSKRGWTTWLTAATDERVAGIIPISYDTLNLRTQMEHQISAWGSYSHSIREYVETGVLNSLEGEPEDLLFRMVDPFTYRKDIEVPKLIVVGTNDPYWPADAAALYYDGLFGEKGLVYAPNAGHDAEISRVLFSIRAMYIALENQLSFPAISCEHTYEQGEGKNAFSLLIDSDAWEFELLRVYTGRSDTRDLRQATWRSQTLTTDTRSFSVTELDSYTGIYFEAAFTYDGAQLLLSTPIKVLEPAR